MRVLAGKAATDQGGMVDPERLELPTPAFEAQCSIQLSYGSVALTGSVPRVL